MALLLVWAVGAQAQPDSAIDRYGREVYRYLTDTAHGPPVEYIRPKSWKNLFELQGWSYQKTEEAKLNVDYHYEEKYRRFYREIGGLQNRILAEKARGVQLRPLHFSYVRSRDTVGIIHGTWQVLLREADMQTVEQWRFPFYFNGRGFMLTGPVRVSP